MLSEPKPAIKQGELRVLLRKPEIYGLEILIEVNDFEEFEAQRAEIHSDHERKRIDDDLISICSAAISTAESEEFYEGSEERILSVIDHRFSILEPGLITTWGGSFSQFPVVQSKAEIIGVGLGLSLTLGPDSILGPSNMNARRHLTESSWHKQRHLDLENRYKPERRFDYRVLANPEEPQALAGDPRRGAHLARAITERRWGRLLRFVDPKPATSEPKSYNWTCLAPELAGGPDVVLTGVGASRLTQPHAN